MFRNDRIQIFVDDFISKAMTYNETLHSEYSLSDFDFAAKQLCKARKRLIRWLRKL